MKKTKPSLDTIIRNKIAVQIVLNNKQTHNQIANFYGISRQLVTLIAKENNLQRTKRKGTEGSNTKSSKPHANFNLINSKFSALDTEKLNTIVGKFN